MKLPIHPSSIPLNHPQGGVTETIDKSFFDNSEPLLTVDEVSSRLQVKKKTIYQWVYKGLIPFVKIGKRLLRFRANEIEQWLQKDKE